MALIGLTGGVGTGKSTFARLFLREFPMESFDSDHCVHQLLETDSSVQSAIAETFGAQVCDDQGRPVRALLRDLVFSNAARRCDLEAILHPRVRACWRALTQTTRDTNASVLVDVPLLYEANGMGDFDTVIVVAAREDTQLQRLTSNRGLAPQLAANIIRAQLDLAAKTEQADHVIWNDSTVSNLDGQTRLLASWLRRRFS